MEKSLAVSHLIGQSPMHPIPVFLSHSYHHFSGHCEINIDKVSILYTINSMDTLESLPYFNKDTIARVLNKHNRNLDKKVQALLDKKDLIPLKRGFYTTRIYWLQENDKKGYLEYIANILKIPSYISLEYVLCLNKAIPEGINAITSITRKNPIIYEESLGSFIYQNMKEDLFIGYTLKKYKNYDIKIASLAKALFDYLYLKTNIRLNLKEEMEEGLRINWSVFEQKDIEEFRMYVKISNSQKMERILDILYELIDSNI